MLKSEHSSQDQFTHIHGDILIDPDKQLTIALLRSLSISDCSSFIPFAIR